MSSTTDDLTLAAEFAPATYDNWRKLVDGVLKGKRCAALHYCEPEIRLAGGIYVDVEPTGAHVDGKLVSAKGWPGLAAFMRECLKVLGTEIRC